MEDKVDGLMTEVVKVLQGHRWTSSEAQHVEGPEGPGSSREADRRMEVLMEPSAS